jgi:hypothetical protein
MPPPRDWFDLQLRFADRAAAIEGVPFEEAVLRCTNIARQLDRRRAWDPTEPIWQEYLRGLRVADDRVAWTVAFVQEHGAAPISGPFGCFSYNYVPETRKIRLHFADRDESGAGPLSRSRVPARLAELRALFAAVARAHPAARTVRGNSWLHGITAYRRLYPPEYAASAIPAPMEEEFPYMGLWGQFLDHTGQVKAGLAADFLARVAEARTTADLAAAFPHRVYEVECAIVYFYAFYGVPVPTAGGR